MILPGGAYHVYLATRPVDFRKGHAGLALVVQTVLGRDPYSGAIFVFRSKRGDRIKILVWDQTGLVLVYKHLEGGLAPLKWSTFWDSLSRMMEDYLDGRQTRKAGRYRREAAPS